MGILRRKSSKSKEEEGKGKEEGEREREREKIRQDETVSKPSRDKTRQS
jgi:hypothetical protein